MIPTSFEIISTTRAWLGTPYQHQASCLGAGADCLGLIRGVYRTLYGAEPVLPPPYTRFAAVDEGELMWSAARLYLDELVPCGIPRLGQVLLFRIRPRSVARHLGIVVGDAVMIHAASGGNVCEITLSAWWLERHVASFAFPSRDESDLENDADNG